MTNAAVLSGLIPPAGRCHISSYGQRRNAILERMSDVWVISPKPCTLAHFAVMPLDLAERCVKAGSSPVRVLLRLRSAVATTSEGLGAVLQVHRRTSTKQAARPICGSRFRRCRRATLWSRCGAHRVEILNTARSWNNVWQVRPSAPSTRP